MSMSPLPLINLIIIIQFVCVYVFYIAATIKWLELSTCLLVFHYKTMN